MTIDPRRIEVIDDKTAAVLRSMTPAARMDMANVMVVQARQMVTHLVRTANASWNEAQVVAEVRRRLSHGTA